MLNPNDPVTQTIKRGAEAALDLESFYEVHGEDLTAQLEARARDKETAIAAIAREVVAARPTDSSSQISDDIRNFGAGAGAKGAGYILFAAQLQSAALGQKVGRFS